MPISGYFDTVFGQSGTLVTVPDALQVDGSVSYTSGWGVDYTLPASSPSYKSIPNGSMNQILFDITTAIQNWQQNTIAPFITTAMNGGTPYSYPMYAMVLESGVGYISNSNSNTDTPPSSNWTVLNLAGASFFSGGVTAGSAAAQTLATVNPVGFALSNDGATVSCTAGFACPGACTFSIGGTTAKSAKILVAGSYVDPPANYFVLNESIFLTRNVTNDIYVITDAPSLGTAAAKSASDNSKSSVASVSGSTTTNHLLAAADTVGTVKDGGSVASNQIYTALGLGAPISASCSTTVAAGATTSAANLTPATWQINGASGGPQPSGDIITGTYQPCNSYLTPASYSLAMWQKVA